MQDIDRPGDLDNESDGDDDDIARFERECAARARAQGQHLVEEEEAQDDLASDEECDKHVATSKIKMAAGLETYSHDGDWQRKCRALQDKLKRREEELSQVKADLSMVKSEGIGTGDPTADLKQRLLHLTKYNRRLQVTGETQKSRIQQLESELRKPREQAKKQAEELASKNMEAVLGDGNEDWKKKFLQASNKLQESRQEVQEVRMQIQRHRKVLQKELGSDEIVERALSLADDPEDLQWKGRAKQISQLQRQVRELQDQLKKAGTANDDSQEGANPDHAARNRRLRADHPTAEKERAPLVQAAEKRREDFERLQEEVERLRSEQAEAKRKRDALKARAGVLEGQVRDLKGHVQTMMQKSENDDELVAAMRRQLGRPALVEESDDIESLKRDHAEAQAQLERQAQIILQMRQKSIASSLDAGSTRLGAAPSTPPGALMDRVRYLEAENTRQSEHIRILQNQADSSSRSGAADTDVRQQKQQMEAQLANALRDNERLRLALQRQSNAGDISDPGLSEPGDPSNSEGDEPERERHLA